MSVGGENAPAKALRAAVLTGDVPAAEALLQAGAPPGIRDAEGLAPLHHAAAAGNLDLAVLLLEYDAEIDGGSIGEERRPLAYAAYHGHVDMVRLLVASGADVSRTGGEPIQHAGQRGQREICRILVECGAVEDLLVPSEATPEVLETFRAAYSYQPERLAALLRSRPELARARDTEGRTPMHAAATNGDAESVQALLRAGAEVDARSDRGETPLGHAVAYRHEAVARALIDAGAVTDFFTACRFGAAQGVIRLLAVNPGLLNATDEMGRSPLVVARLHGRKPIVRLLLERGATDPEGLGRRSLKGSVLASGDRRGALVEDSDLRGSVFLNSNLSGATWQNISLSGSSFHDIDLSNAGLEDVNLSGVRLRNVNFAGARLEGVALEGLTIDGIEILPLLRAEKQRRADAGKTSPAAKQEAEP